MEGRGENGGGLPGKKGPKGCSFSISVGGRGERVRMKQEGTWGVRKRQVRESQGKKGR